MNGITITNGYVEIDIEEIDEFLDQAEANYLAQIEEEEDTIE